ncbi:hypothetical protein IW140_003108 [Coemansia sp. RSA 1813]|nr:hypothetical protein LPJ74_004229 [Coemansia sp. RSA 1843]KAJ2089507.1 hypothetical protein IW138_003396 [Coemansia sp. RSA 986]KAJ2569405.1 hypothetical protein IW140_003108 [Coemansia sp. RSA 1813]
MNSISQIYSQSQGYSSGSGQAGGPQVHLQGRLNTIKNRIRTTSDIIEQAVQSCTVAAIDLGYLDEDERIAEVDQALRKLLDAQHELEVEEGLLSSLATDADPDTAIEGYTANRTRSLQKYSSLSDNRKYGNNAKYRNFRQQIWDIKHEGEPMPSLFSGTDQGRDDDDEDEDLVIAGARMNYKCPLTASWLTDPVTSKVCKHSFSNTAITDYIRSNGGSYPCPVGGCRHRIRLQDLYADKVLERKVSNHLRRLEEEESAATYTLVQ